MKIVGNWSKNMKTNSLISNRKSHRILLVEDEMETRFLIKKILERDGFQVISTTNGKCALGLFNSSIDLVLTDIVMPKVGGIELIRELKKINPEIKCIAMTGYSYEKIPPDIPLLLKPFSYKRLIEVIRKILSEPEIQIETRQEQLEIKRKIASMYQIFDKNKEIRGNVKWM